MRKWRVINSDGRAGTLEATDMKIIDGCLVFYNYQKYIIYSFGRDRWKFVEQL